MQTGFFFERISSLDPIIDFANQNNLELKGVWVKENSRLGNNQPLYNTYEDLVSKIDLAIIFMEEEEAFKIASMAIRKGVAVYLSRFLDFNLEKLLSLKELATEIGGNIGFGFCGMNLIPADLIHGPFLIQITRELNKGTNDLLFNRYLLYDLASIVRLRSCSVRKIRVFGAPTQEKSIRVLNLRIEFDNNSVVSYTNSRVGEADTFRYQYFDGEKCIEKQLDSSTKVLLNYAISDFLLVDAGYANGLKSFIQELDSKSSPSFGVDKAVETFSYSKNIEDKLRQPI